MPTPNETKDDCVLPRSRFLALTVLILLAVGACGALVVVHLTSRQVKSDPISAPPQCFSLGPEDVLTPADGDGRYSKMSYPIILSNCSCVDGIITWSDSKPEVSPYIGPVPILGENGTIVGSVDGPIYCREELDLDFAAEHCKCSELNSFEDAARAHCTLNYMNRYRFHGRPDSEFWFDEGYRPAVGICEVDFTLCEYTEVYGWFCDGRTPNETLVKDYMHYSGRPCTDEMFLDFYGMGVTDGVTPTIYCDRVANGTVPYDP